VAAGGCGGLSAWQCIRVRKKRADRPAIVAASRHIEFSKKKELVFLYLHFLGKNSALYFILHLNKMCIVSIAQTGESSLYPVYKF
jgi:hypothetical protein